MDEIIILRIRHEEKLDVEKVQVMQEDSYIQERAEREAADKVP